MNRLSISVIIETITRDDYAPGAVADDLQGSIEAVRRQTYPRELIETIVVVDQMFDQRGAEEILRRHPSVKLVHTPEHNYFAAKNAGAQAASGSLVVLLDGDCEPAADWLEMLASRFEPGVDAVAGRTRYTGNSLGARTFSVSDFSNVVGDETGAASGFNLNNVAFRREVLLAHPLDTRIRRNGGCYLLYHQLRAGGARILYEPRATVRHGLDIRGFGFVKKHFERGFDGVGVYRVDDGAVLRGTRLFRRFGVLALVALTCRRVVFDWLRLLRDRRQIGVSLSTLPYFALVSLMVRLIELTGGVTALARSRRATMVTAATPR
jgi:glycosyltransferase involved in cell wall biosynthesis